MVNGQSPVKLTFHYGAIEPEKVINPRTKAKN